MAPRDEEELLLYISATPQVISMVLVAEREEAEGVAGTATPGEHAGSTEPGLGLGTPDPSADTPDPGAVTPGSDDITPDPR